MTLSLWRYAHLVLALVSCLFLTVASVTGVILAADAVNEKLPPYKVENFSSITLAESLPALRKAYPEISEITVDHNGFVTLQGLDEEFNDINVYVDPRTGKILGKPEKKSELIQWTTSLHRSLFLHEGGRIFVGVNAFLLLFISISGVALILQRQRGIKRFFGKITKDGFNQYWHVVLGRLMLFPIIALALTGTYLSMERFHLFGEEKSVAHNIKTETNAKQQDLSITPLFKNTRLADVQKIQFPFTDDPEEYYTLKLADREIIASQFTGAILSEIPYSSVSTYAALSLSIHTGRIGIVWAIILAMASLNILFFIYSGFAMTLRRRATKIKNKFKAQESNIILLAGSENGSTLRFANAIHQQLLASGHASFLAQPNDYKAYPKAAHIILFTSTHGLGDAPSNATKLLDLVQKHPQQQSVNVSVVGFGSRAYPDFCGFAHKAHTAFNNQNWANAILPVFTVNDKSAAEFTEWVKAWAGATDIPLAITPALYSQKPKNLQKIKVIAKQTDGAQTFMLTLKAPRGTNFTSGDLLAIYPANDNRERLYSIGKIDGKIQLVVKLHVHGLGSAYLDNLKIGDTFKARIVQNNAFHLPKGKPVIMIANGTGIAPFLGMLEQAGKKYEYQLYSGFRAATPLTNLHLDFARAEMQKHHLKGFHMAFSREANKMYVMDLIRRDAAFFAEHVEKGGAIMLCGSIAMQQDVEATLDKTFCELNKKTLAYYKEKGQLLADCY